MLRFPVLGNVVACAYSWRKVGRDGRWKCELEVLGALTHNLNCKSPLVEVGTLDANNDGVLDEEELKAWEAQQRGG